MSTAKLRPFKLEEFKSNEATPVVDEHGEKLEVFVRSRCPSQFPVIACKEGDFGAFTFTFDGRQLPSKPVSIFFAPRKKVVPLSLDDIKPGMAFRIKAENIHRFPSAAGPQGLSFASFGFFTYTELQGGWLYSFDCLTWHRCEKEVEA